MHLWTAANSQLSQIYTTTHLAMYSQGRQKLNDELILVAHARQIG